MRINSFVAAGALRQDTAVLSPEESHHLARVLRAGPGQELTLFDGEGTRAEAVITAVSKKAVAVRIIRCEKIPPPAVEITLIQALPKPDRFEWVLQKAVELGVRCIQPVLSEHTVRRPNHPEKQAERWRSIICNAAQQCGASWLPELSPLCSLAAVPLAFDIAFIGSLQPGAKPFRAACATLNRSAIKTAALLIGPEGDFTEAEVQTAVAAGAVPVSFGPNILRTETAALFGLSVLAYELF